MYVPGRKVTVINAGISGSDIYFEYMLLKEQLILLHPDLVIVMVNHSDVEDIIIRGGMERFQPRGRSGVRRKGPHWESVYGISYIFRHIIDDGLGYNWLLLTPDEVIAEEQAAVEKIRRGIGEFSKLGRDCHLAVLFVFLPYEVEINKGRYYPPGFNDLVSNLRASDGIYMIDVRQYYWLFFWQIDAHYNTKGYETVGTAIANKILEFRFLKTQNS